MKLAVNGDLTVGRSEKTFRLCRTRQNIECIVLHPGQKKRNLSFKTTIIASFLSLNNQPYLTDDGYQLLGQSTSRRVTITLYKYHNIGAIYQCLQTISCPRFRSCCLQRRQAISTPAILSTVLPDLQNRNWDCTGLMPERQGTCLAISEHNGENLFVLVSQFDGKYYHRHRRSSRMIGKVLMRTHIRTVE